MRNGVNGALCGRLTQDLINLFLARDRFTELQVFHILEPYNAAPMALAW